MVQLSTIHWVYFGMVILIITTMALRRDTVLPCIVGILLVGFVSTGNLWRAVQILFNALIAAGTEFLGLITVIGLVVAMSKAMGDVGSDYLIMSPAARIMVNADVAFWVLGFVMLIVTLFIWPSPAVALIGAIMLPIAVRGGLSVMGAAVAMNIFGHGLGLSGDYVIQGAPAITAKAAGFANATPVMSASFPLWLTMGIVTTILSYIFVKRDLKRKDKDEAHRLVYEKADEKQKEKRYSFASYLGAALFIILFLVDIFLLIRFKLRGGDATALIGGTALIITAVIAVSGFGAEALEKITDYVREGFLFGMKVFAPVIVIGGFFFLGSESTAKAILGPQATGLLSDLGIALSQSVPLSKVPVAFIQMIIGGITGLDGSGFSGLPLVGSLAQTFSTAIHADKATLGALGQISAIWVGGGTIIPWGIIPVAAITGVDPNDLARKNFIPVIVGLIVTTIVAIFLL
ncbi:hypothetical protein [Thermoanaerobacterium sp. DL9XJH110]|uniref:hypothetical protein n=1 Tax=Thermoanaerobacterium sp. DL9XJH110 TaxID=3386643 RepID=UPI003BB4F13D